MEKIEKINETIDEFAAEIKSRMKDQYDKGYRGWDGGYSEHRLARELNVDSCELIKLKEPIKNAIDIGARAMMLWYRHSKRENPQPSGK